MRIDVWDIEKSGRKENVIFDRGYPKDFESVFTVGKAIGSGGFGRVRVVTENSSGHDYACKSIRKRLDVPNVSIQRQEQHLLGIDREIKVLRLLRGTLSVVYLKGVWEDEEDIHIVMEYCKGGELYNSIGRQPYTEERVSVYMRSVLQMLSQCHAHKILHRDIKPGNFLLLSTEENSPLKAIDFGLAAFFDPRELPRTDLGLDGTPWFMAPEVLNSETYPSSDVWSAGVMCYQLLCGYLPFDDVQNKKSPSLSVVWKSILTEDLSFKGSAWKNVSNEAKDFVAMLLNRDQAARPSAKQALGHSWLQNSFHQGKARNLDDTVVQRIQRFGQINLLQRTILELIASELLTLRPQSLPDPTMRGKRRSSPSGSIPSSDSSRAEDSQHGDGMLFPLSPSKGKNFLGQQSMSPQSLSPLELSHVPKIVNKKGKKAATIHGGREYWRILRQASDLALQGSGHGRSDYLHTFSRTPQEKMEQRKAARLSLDTSVHGARNANLSRQGRPSGSGNQSLPSLNNQPLDATETKTPVFPEMHGGSEAKDILEEGGRGRSFALQALEATSQDTEHGINYPETEAKIVDTMPKETSITDPKTLEKLMGELKFRKGKAITKESLVAGLSRLGYEVQPEEVSSLMEMIDLNKNDTIEASEFVASQLDWRDLQRNNKDLWIECARRAFEDLDSRSAGHITVENIVSSLRNKLPEEEINYAVENALVESGVMDPEQVDFEGFLRMVQMGSRASLDSLDQYDPRI